MSYSGISMRTLAILGSHTTGWHRRGRIAAIVTVSGKFNMPLRQRATGTLASN